ncbi:hypothetical protein BZG74_13785 [Salinivibrio sharmensis]|uniref:YDG domain-containing protein n=1 Tax=Salinivibrio sharmensis TaxID=390883 RepID=A0ABX3K9M6_9GAMM|nr:hypothetical protein BZG74_13785 [Salinivibrio sharmensis]
MSLEGTAAGAFADKNVGDNKAVTVTGLTLTGDDAGNYTLVAPNGLTASISKANLDVTGLTAESKTYDATTNANLSGTAAINALGNDQVSLEGTATGAFADKNVGDNKAVTVTGLTLTGDDAGNYTLVAPNGLTASITASRGNDTQPAPDQQRVAVIRKEATSSATSNVFSDVGASTDTQQLSDGMEIVEVSEADFNSGSSALGMGPQRIFVVEGGIRTVAGMTAQEEQ